jgi:pSer/pThr/pTyr-binding forkhead associated (FHA) protein
MPSWKLTFEVLVGSRPVQRITVVKADNDRCVVGRGPDCDVRCDSAAISRKHCAVTVIAGEASIEDLGSSGGTFLNRNRIRGPAPLKPGDVVFAGQPKLTLVSIEPA